VTAKHGTQLDAALQAVRCGYWRMDEDRSETSGSSAFRFRLEQSPGQSDLTDCTQSAAGLAVPQPSFRCQDSAAALIHQSRSTGAVWIHTFS
jgi:hypothetical protein